MNLFILDVEVVNVLRQTRMFIVLLGMTFMIGILGVRLLWLQSRGVIAPFHKSADWVERSVAQRAAGVVLDSGRGRIVDRYGEPLAGISIRSLLLLPVQTAPPTPAAIAELGRAIRVKPDVLERKWRALRQPALWAADANSSPVELTEEQERRIRKLGLPGAIPVNAVRRYEQNDAAAAQFVGFVTEWPERIYSTYSKRLHTGSLTAATPIGASGLELAFDRYLQGIRPKAIVTYTDNTGKPLSGIGIRELTSDNGFYPLQLVSTVDKQLQEQIEEASDRLGLIRGSIVVLDARTGDVAAMVSRPRFDPNEAGKSNSGWRNRGLVALTPGSIFKSAVAAAALEEGVVSANERFFCDGDFGKYGLTCWKKGGHGHLTFEEGFAQSCNIVFAEVAGRLSAERLESYTRAFGLTGTVGWSGTSTVDGEPIRHFPEEERGKLFAAAASSKDGGVLAQTGIGQRDVRLTPLAAANWVVTLLQDGFVASPRAASSIRFANGLTMEQYRQRRSSDRPAMSARTARELLSMMTRVVEEGTGAGLRDAKWKVAGKSGTAQVTIGGKPYVHQWFIGFGPVGQPKYAVAVVAEQRPPGSTHAAMPLFKEVMNILADRNQR